jgi:hypothetical protein
MATEIRKEQREAMGSKRPLPTPEDADRMLEVYQQYEKNMLDGNDQAGKAK